MTDYQARDLYTDAALALDADGKFLALRADLVGNLGAHTVSFVPLQRAPAVTIGLQAKSQLRADTWRSDQHGTYWSLSRRRPSGGMHTIERLIDMAAAKPVSTG